MLCATAPSALCRVCWKRLPQDKRTNPTTGFGKIGCQVAGERFEVSTSERPGTAEACLQQLIALVVVR